MASTKQNTHYSNMDSLGEESIKFSKKDMMFKDFDIFRAGVLFT